MPVQKERLETHVSYVRRRAVTNGERGQDALARGESRFSRAMTPTSGVWRSVGSDALVSELSTWRCGYRIDCREVFGGFTFAK